MTNRQLVLILKAIRFHALFVSAMNQIGHTKPLKRSERDAVDEMEVPLSKLIAEAEQAEGEGG